MANIYDLIDEVRLRPGVYVGAETATGLDLYLGGAMHALAFFHVDAHEQPPFDDFALWLARRLGQRPTPGGWSRDVLREAGGDESLGLQLFFRFLDEFRRARQVALMKGITASPDRASSDDESLRRPVHLTIIAYPEVELFVTRCEREGDDQRYLPRGHFVCIDDAIAEGARQGVQHWQQLTP